MTTPAQEPGAAADQRRRDMEAMAMIRASGILNPNARLDDVLKLSERLGAQAQAGHVFIFREVVFVECPF